MKQQHVELLSQQIKFLLHMKLMKIGIKSNEN
jgi:hypothetical protein